MQALAAALMLIHTFHVNQNQENVVALKDKLMKNMKNSVIIYSSSCRWKVRGGIGLQQTFLEFQSKTVLLRSPENLK